MELSHHLTYPTQQCLVSCALRAEGMSLCWWLTCCGSLGKWLTLCSACVRDSSARGISCSLVFKMAWSALQCQYSSTSAFTLSLLRAVCQGLRESRRGNLHSLFGVTYSLAACFDHVVFEPILKNLAAPEEKTGCL